MTVEGAIMFVAAAVFFGSLVIAAVIDSAATRSRETLLKIADRLLDIQHTLAKRK